MDVSELPGPRNLHFTDQFADHFANHFADNFADCFAEYLSDHVSDHAANLFLQTIVSIVFPVSFEGVFTHFATNQMRCTDARDRDGSLALVSSAHGNLNKMYLRKIITTHISKLNLRTLPRRGPREFGHIHIYIYIQIHIISAAGAKQIQN